MASSSTAARIRSGRKAAAGGGGFGKVDRKNLVLTVGQILTIDAALPAASVSTQVEVTSESPLVDTDKTEVAQTIGESVFSVAEQLSRLRARAGVATEQSIVSKEEIRHALERDASQP